MLEILQKYFKKRNENGKTINYIIKKKYIIYKIKLKKNKEKYI